VLTQLPAALAARVLKEMPAETSADLANRLSALDEIPDRAVLEASESLVRALAASGGLASSDRRSDFDGLAFAASIVNEMNGDDGDALLDRMASIDEGAAARVREAMFTFEDLLRVDARSMAPLLRTVQSDTMVTALQTAGETLRNHFFAGLSQRAAATLREDLAASAPRRVSEVEAAQREIIEAAMRLAAEGALKLPPRGGEA
jgi:flagellar motor switch protein FliG